MFSKTNSSKSKQDSEALRKVPAKSTSSVPSILGPDIVIIGDISSAGDIQIDGRHEGNLIAAKVTIGENGSVTGNIKAKWVHIRGKVSGKISANVVELAASANVQADIAQDQLTIANGAFFDGKCTRLTKTAAAKPAPIQTQSKTVTTPVSGADLTKKTG